MEDFILIKWDKKLSVGIPKIDDQHQYFIRLVGETVQLLNEKNQIKLNKKVPELINYATIHFTTEEEIFDKYSYPFAKEHKESHERIMRTASELFEEAKLGMDINPKLNDFLKDYIENHLKGLDAKYAKYFKENKINIE